MLWVNFLHFYQPPDSENAVVREATDKSYRRVVRALFEHPQIKFTINIAGCLVERWGDLGYQDLIEQIKTMAARGQIELTGSAAYHALLPLVDKKEAIRQIEENEKILMDNFGVRPQGFFPPEMAYDNSLGKAIKKIGYQWVILDEIAASGDLSSLDYSKNYIDKVSGLKIFFRNRRQSNSFAPDLILKDFKSGQEKEEYLTATDGELYGLRHIDPTAEFEKLLKNKKLKTQTISEYLANKREIKKIKIIASSWESAPEEIEAGEPFALWNSKHNKIQKKLWQLADFSYHIVEENNLHENYFWGRWHLVRGLASCAFWWASQRDFSHIFGPEAWNPDEINKKVEELVRAVRTFEDKTSLHTKMKAEKMAAKIKELVWEHHWKMKHKNKI